MFMLEIHMVNEFMMRFTDKKHLMLIETYWKVSRMETRGNLFDHMDTYNVENKYQMLEKMVLQIIRGLKRREKGAMSTAEEQLDWIATAAEDGVQVR
ncbi:hypothetical protein AcV7_005520 [Taiwanofungus camphoratus]|nr:hypothetical protein AcV7_005520 [Antrodia cinnamomea]